MGLGTTHTTNDRVVAVVQQHAASLLRIARAHSLCADDAQDAYQRALEIYLEHLDRVDHATAGPWLRTVCKHEAMRIRDQRQRVLAPDDVAWDAQESLDACDAQERAVSLERVARAAEALQGCKPDEATALLLKADGSSYAEIGELTGWSYTKVNRCLAEGRARFLRRFDAIDSGAACEGWAGVLSAIVDGQATPDDFAAVRPHLRHCAACRATLRSLYDAEPALGALVPAGLLGTAALEPGVSGIVTRAYEAVVTGLGERVARAHALVELATSTKAAAVAASTAAVAAGGLAAADGLPAAPERPAARVAAAPAREGGRIPPPAPRARARATAAPVARGPKREVPRREAAPAPSPVPAPTSAATPAPEPAPDFAFEGARTAPAAPAPPTVAGASMSAAPARPSRRSKPGGTAEFGFEG